MTHTGSSLQTREGSSVPASKIRFAHVRAASRGIEFAPARLTIKACLKLRRWFRPSPGMQVVGSSGSSGAAW